MILLFDKKLQKTLFEKEKKSFDRMVKFGYGKKEGFDFFKIHCKHLSSFQGEIFEEDSVV